MITLFEGVETGSSDWSSLTAVVGLSILSETGIADFADTAFAGAWSWPSYELILLAGAFWLSDSFASSWLSTI